MPLRSDLRGLSLAALISAARKGRATAPKDATAATKRVLRGLAERWKALDDEVAGLDKELAALVKQTAPVLLELRGVGVDVTGTLLVAAGDNPARLSDEAAFAAMCGVSPVDASSGRQQQHRLNRGGNRDANRAVWVVALVRLRSEPRTRAYVERRTNQGLSKPEILGCSKRYIAREVFRHLRTLKRSDDTQITA